MHVRRNVHERVILLDNTSKTCSIFIETRLDNINAPGIVEIGL